MVQDKYREEGSVCPIGFKATQNYMLSDVTKIFFHSRHTRDELKLCLKKLKKKNGGNVFYYYFLLHFF